MTFVIIGVASSSSYNNNLQHRFHFVLVVHLLLLPLLPIKAAQRVNEPKVLQGAPCLFLSSLKAVKIRQLQ